MMVKNYKKFLLLTLFIIIFFNIFYLIVFNSIIKKDEIISSDYQHFLLKNSISPRLIIESGSNSEYGLDSQMIAQSLSIPTINISDNAGNALRYKLLRLQKYTKAGDIVLLPLEWQYYSRERLTVPFTEYIFNQYHYYYDELDMLERLKFSYKIPFGSLVKRVQYIFQGKNKDTNTLSELIQLVGYMQRYKKGDRGEIQEKYEMATSKMNTNGIESCYEYILSMQIENGFVLSQTFKENIKLIKELQKKGVHTLLTWPSVVGDDCYNKKYNREIRIFSEEIRAFLEEQKIPVIGNIEDGQFSKKYFYNTFYHVLYDAKRIRTKRLIKEIERSKYSKWFNKNTTVALSNFEKLYELMRKKSEKIKKKSEIIFLSGWYDKESWGRWSHGEESSLLIFLAKEQVDKVIKLNINSRIYGANRKIFLRVEDKPVGFINLEGNKTLTLPTVSKGNNIITLQFQYFDVKSPSQTEENNSDGRQIKLGIESIKLITSD